MGCALCGNVAKGECAEDSDLAHSVIGESVLEGSLKYRSLPLHPSAKIEWTVLAPVKPADHSLDTMLASTDSTFGRARSSCSSGLLGNRDCSDAGDELPASNNILDRNTPNIAHQSCLRKISAAWAHELHIGEEMQTYFSQELRIYGLSGETCTVFVDSSFSWAEVKQAIEAKTCIPANGQRLLISDREVYDDDRVGAEKGVPTHVSLLRRTPEEAKWIDQVKDDWMSLESAPELIRGNKEVVICAIREHGCAIQFACESLRADLELVTMATRGCGNALKHAKVELQQIEDLKRLATNAFRCLDADSISDRS
eukprot:TRINITY_DN63198_c0_g1_i1.p1 TRINITY_DN63198_c0_g1~~TRINITY_DN63198_c0_g1_i1.p1  ORF type:complete len:312 (+),score=38.84 TRINITY_DN63198_c0_g1_i1:57-992(+)